MVSNNLHSTINITVGRFAIVGVGSIITRNFSDYGFVVENLAHLFGYVCRGGEKMEKRGNNWYCLLCDWTYETEEIHDTYR